MAHSRNIDTLYIYFYISFLHYNKSLDRDTVSYGASVGDNGGNFRAGSFAQSVIFGIKLVEEDYELGVCRFILEIPKILSISNCEGFFLSFFLD